MSENSVNKYAKERLSEEEIDRIVKNHTEWLDSGYTRGQRANFRDKCLSGHNFYGLCLKRADFRNSNLSGTNIVFCDVIKADFKGANFFATNLECTNIFQANLKGSNFDLLRWVGDPER